MIYPMVTTPASTTQQTVAHDLTEGLQGPMEFRIGPPRHDYCYQKLGEVLYRCKKKSEWGRDGQKLFLLLNEGWWVAFDAPEQAKTVEEVLAVGNPVFRSQAAVLEEGWHTWATNDAAPSNVATWLETGLSCLTTHL